MRLIIFDLDGTLVDAYPAIIESFNYTMHKLGYPAQDNLTIRRAVGWGDANLIKPFVKAKDLKKALAIYRRHHAEALIKKASTLPGVPVLLRTLKKQGFILAIASNRPTRFSKILIRSLGLERYFDYILCADKLRYPKPHPEILEKIMYKLCVTPKDTLYVGDMTIDVQAGRSAKVNTVIVEGGSSLLEEIKQQKPYRIIYKPLDLLKILKIKAQK